MFFKIRAFQFTRGSMGNNFPAVFKKIGLNSLYIVDSSGLPILIRNYFADEYSDEKNIIITSFASAITIFAQNILVSFISDIGIEDKRLFFKYQSDFIYLLVFDEDKLKGLTLNKLHELMAITVWRLDAIFKEFYHNELKSDESKSLPIDIERKESKIDTFLAKGCLDWFEIQEKSVSVVDLKKRIVFQKSSKNKFLKDIGLSAFYLLNKKNQPLFTKLFVPTNPLIENEETVSAFLTAIESFSRIYLSSLQDVGMFNQRLFIRDSKYCRIAIVIDDLKFLAQSRFEEESVIQMFFENIEKELSKFLRRPKRNKRALGSSSRRRRKPKQLTKDHIKNFSEFSNKILKTTFQQYKDQNP